MKRLIVLRTAANKSRLFYIRFCIIAAVDKLALGLRDRLLYEEREALANLRESRRRHSHAIRRSATERGGVKVRRQAAVCGRRRRAKLSRWVRSVCARDDAGNPLGRSRTDGKPVDFHIAAANAAVNVYVDRLTSSSSSSLSVF